MLDLLRLVLVAAKRLWRQPGYSFVATGTVAVSVGMTCAVFAVADAVWLRPLPVRQEGRLVAIERPYFSDSPVTTWGSITDFLDWRERARVFEDLGMARVGERDVVLSDEVERRVVFEVSANLFALLGLRPLRGRTFLPGEDRPDAERVVILSESYWRSRFGADDAVLGKALTLRRWEGSQERYTVVGVLPKEFQFEYGLAHEGAAALFLPFADWPIDRTNRKAGGVTNRVYGRLRPGVTTRKHRRR